VPKFRVRDQWSGGRVFETECEFCNSYFNVFKGGGHIVREDGEQHFFVCGLCARVFGLIDLKEGWYRIGLDMETLWYWKPASRKRRTFTERCKKYFG